MSTLEIRNLPVDLRYADVADAAKAAGLSFDECINDTATVAVRFTNPTYAGNEYRPRSHGQTDDEFARKFSAEIARSLETRTLHPDGVCPGGRAVTVNYGCGDPTCGMPAFNEDGTWNLIFVSPSRF
jgi:hypothetical protein